MDRIDFEGLPSTKTPISPNNLNLLQDNIEAEFGFKSIKREFQITFDDGLENAKCNIELGALATYNGHFKIELIGNYLNENYTGLIERHFDLLVNNGEIALQEGKYTYVSNNVAKAFAVPRIYVGSGGVVKIQVCSLTTAKKRCTLIATMYADNTSYLDVLKNAKLSNVFTSDPTAYESPSTSENIVTGTEHKTDRLIDGKEEYEKIIDFDNLPNATTKSVAHGLTNVSIKGQKCAFSNGTTSIIFSNVGANPSTGKTIVSYVGAVNVGINCADDMSAYSGTVTLYYTKNS